MNGEQLRLLLNWGCGIFVVIGLIGESVFGENWIRSRGFAFLVACFIVLVCSVLAYSISHNIMLPGR